MMTTPVELRVHRDTRPWIAIAVIGMLLSLSAIGGLIAVTDLFVKSNHRHDATERILRADQVLISANEAKNAALDKKLDQQQAELDREAAQIGPALQQAAGLVENQLRQSREYVIILSNELRAHGIAVTVPPPLPKGKL